MNSVKTPPKLVAARYLGQRQTLAARYKAVCRDQAKLRHAALKQVKRWEWFSAPAVNLNPGYFFMEHDLGGAFLDVKQGRKLSGKPALKGKMVRHGLDNDGKLRAIEHADGSMEFRQYFDDRIEAAFYEKNRPPTLQVLWPATGLPEALVFYNPWVMTLRTYFYDDAGRLKEVFEAKGYHGKPFQTRLVEAWPEWSRRFARQTGTQAPVKRPKNPVPVLDLQKELPEIEAFIEKAVSQFAERQKKSSGSRKLNPVCGVGIQFKHYGQGSPPEFLISFDTRDKFEDDGTWTHQFVAARRRPTWEKVCAAQEKAADNEILVDAHGKKHWIDGSSEPLRWFGGLLGKALLSVSRRPAFRSLQKTKRCVLLVHDIDFAFHWRR